MDDEDKSKEANKPLVLRESEFFGGCIRVKISVKNTSSLAILDATLELESDERILHFDRCEPEYPEKKGKLLLGNINPNTDRTIAFYLDPLICAKEGTDVNCRVSFKDAFGRPDSVQMEPLKIKVVCPIFRTEHDINIGRLKELVSGLQFHDSKVYTIPRKVEISELLRTCRDVIQLHDVRHIKTFKTTDEKTYEAWYYGKTKVTKKDLVIKCSVQRDTESIEVFAAGNDPSDITGLLAEIGRNLTKEFERLGKVQPVFNIHIKDSIIQRSNLLSFCNLDGTCGGNVVIEDSVVQRSNIASWNEGAQKEREEAQKREKEEEERLLRQKEQEERTLMERKAREDAERRESERQKATQEEERISKEREKLSISEKKEGISQIKFLAVALVIGLLLLGYWVLAPGAIDSPHPLKSTPSPTATIIQTPKFTPAASPTITKVYTLPDNFKSLSDGLKLIPPGISWAYFVNMKQGIGIEQKFMQDINFYGMQIIGSLNSEYPDGSFVELHDVGKSGANVKSNAGSIVDNILFTRPYIFDSKDKTNSVLALLKDPAASANAYSSFKSLLDKVDDENAGLAKIYTTAPSFADVSYIGLIKSGSDINGEVAFHIKDNKTVPLAKYSDLKNSSVARGFKSYEVRQENDILIVRMTSNLNNVIAEATQQYGIDIMVLG